MICYLMIVEVILILEAYNKYLKAHLGKKHGLPWINFINFIRNDAFKIETNNNANTNNNIRFKSKKSKFESSKYTEKKIFSNENSNNKAKIKSLNFNNIFSSINLENNITNINWIKWHNYSCWYDCFLTLFCFIFFDYLKENKNLLNKDINYLVNVDKGNFQFNNELIDDIWKYMINNNIDINVSKQRNGVINLVLMDFIRTDMLINYLIYLKTVNIFV